MTRKKRKKETYTLAGTPFHVMRGKGKRKRRLLEKGKRKNSAWHEEKKKPQKVRATHQPRGVSRTPKGTGKREGQKGSWGNLILIKKEKMVK